MIHCQPKLNWRKAEEHSEKFEDGEQLFVYDRWDRYQVLNIEADSDFLNILDEKKEYWGNDWTDVVYWLPLSELEATLPEDK